MCKQTVFEVLYMQQPKNCPSGNHAWLLIPYKGDLDTKKKMSSHSEHFQASRILTNYRDILRKCLSIGTAVQRLYACKTVFMQPTHCHQSNTNYYYDICSTRVHSWNFRWTKILPNSAMLRSIAEIFHSWRAVHVYCIRVYGGGN